MENAWSTIPRKGPGLSSSGDFAPAPEKCEGKVVAECARRTQPPLFPRGMGIGQMRRFFFRTGKPWLAVVISAFSLAFDYAKGIGMKQGGFHMEKCICKTCGTQFPPSEQPPEACPICCDERQYIGYQGQQWTTLAQMQKDGFRNEFREQWQSIERVGHRVGSAGFRVFGNTGKHTRCKSGQPSPGGGCPAGQV